MKTRIEGLDVKGEKNAMAQEKPHLCIYIQIQKQFC